MRLIIVEKPLIAKTLAKAIRATWPDEEIIILSAVTITMVSFILPRGLAYSSYPMTTEPQCKPNPERWHEPHFEFCWAHPVIDAGVAPTIRLTVEATSDLINRADHIVCAPDWDYTGVWGIEQLFKLFRPGLLTQDLPVIRINGALDDKSIGSYLTNTVTRDLPEYQKLKNAGRIKFYFDYNYSLNCLPVLGNLYRDVFNTDQPVFISKYALQTLFYVHEQGEKSINRIESNMAGHHWSGTGKYPVDSYRYLDGIGSPASRVEITRQLVSLGLCSQLDTILAVTDKGREFIARLHSDTRDFDLPFRLDIWMGMTFEKAKPKIDTYLKTLFGKQKRFQRI